MSYYDDDGIDFHDDGNDSVQLKYESLGRETKAAWLVRFEITKDLDTVEEWLPKSRCSLGKNDTIWAPKWLVDEKGLGCYEA